MKKKCLTFPALSVKYYFRKSQHLWRGAEWFNAAVLKSPRSKMGD